MKAVFLFSAIFLLIMGCDNHSGSITKVENQLPSAINNHHQTTTTEHTTQPSLDVNSLTGTYLFGDKKDEEGGYQQLLVEALPNKRIKFELFVQHGGPSFHSGFAEGQIEVKGNTAVWETDEYDGHCKIVFTFSEKNVNVEQAEGGDMACGFGSGVMSGGILDKVDSKKPAFEDN